MGKPLGTQSDQPQKSSQTVASPANGDGVRDPNGMKIIPDIGVKKIQTDRRGDKILVRAWITNNSPDQLIRVDSSYLIKQKRTHNQEIRTGDTRELVLYDGPAPRNDNESKAQITFRLMQNGDVFMENYRIEYNLESDGIFTVEEFHDDGPTRDV